MSLRNRSLLSIIIATLLLTVLSAFHSYYSFLSDYKELEIADIIESAIQTHDSLNNKLEELTALTNDWSAWDDTYKFAQDKNDDYLASNLVDGTFENLELNLIAIFDTQGQVIYEKAFDLEAFEEQPVSREIYDHFDNNPEIFSSNDEDNVEEICISGFLPYNEKLTLFSLCPILTSLDEGPSRGYLLFTKQSNEKLLNQLRSSRDSEIFEYPFDDQLIPEDSMNIKITDPAHIEIYIHEINNELIEHYLFVYDIQGKPIFIIKESEKRTIHTQGLINVRNQVMFIIFVCISAGAILARLLDKYILSRISTLHNSVIAYRNNPKTKEPVCLPGNDELSRLSFEIDNTLHSLLITQNKLNGYLQYGNLMVDISTKFINLPISKIDQSLQKVLETVCKYVNVDRGQILIFKENENSIEKIYEWQKNAISSIKKDFLKINKNTLRWAFKQLNIGNSIIISRVNDLPQTANTEKSILEKHNIQSVIGVPLMVTGKLIGLIAIQMISQPRVWDEQTPILMEIISNIIANAVDRKRNEIQLENSKQFQYELNQITKTSIEKETYISSIRTLSRQLCSLISSDQCWLILHEDKQNLHVYESGKEVNLNDDISKVINFLVEKTLKNSYIHNSTSPQSKKEPVNLDLIGKSFITLPLSAKKKHMGLIILVNNENHDFTALEQGICQQAAKQITLAIIKIRALEESQELSRNLQNLREAIVEFSSVLDIEKLRDTILSRAVNLLQAEGGEFYTYDKAANELITKTSLNMNGDYSGTRLKIGQGAAGRSVELKKIFSIMDYSKWTNRIPTYENAKIRASLSMPLMVGEKVLGCVSVFQYKENKNFSKNDENMLNIFAQHASIAMDNAMLFNKIQEMAHIDELTGLINRRALNEIGDYEIRRSIRLNRPIAVVMVDLDQFKRINDTYSHLVGDMVLKDVGRVFRENLRNIDILGRYGGDECIIIMPETNLENAVQTIKRVQEKLRESIFENNGHKIRITASYGISAYFENPPSLLTMIEEADAAMYRAKDAGRDCIRVYNKK